MKNPKYILIFYSGLFKRLLLFFTLRFSLLTLLTLLTLQTVFTQWVQQTLPVNKPITGIEFIDTLHGWACTSQGADTGYILYTSNGGTNWLVQLSAYYINFTDVDMLNSLTGYVSGADNNIALYKLFKTTNGGVNWTFTTMVPNMYIGDMQFINKDSAWESGVSVGADVRTTTDGGNTWIVRTNGLLGETGRVFFLNYSTGFVSAYPGICKTTNAGLNWTPNGSFSGTVFGIFFFNENTGWVSLAGHEIGKTTNAGLNWTVQHPFDPRPEGIYDIYFIGNIGWAASGWGGKILKSTDGGIIWGYQNTSLFSGTKYFSFTDTTNGWCGNFGISHTTNGGGAITLGIASINSEIPKFYKLYQNFPNPFNSQTIIKIDIIRNSNVKLFIYDVLGKEISVLINQQLNSGSYKLDWEAENYPSGLYFYKLIVDGNIIDTKKMILVK